MIGSYPIPINNVVTSIIRYKGTGIVSSRWYPNMISTLLSPRPIFSLLITKISKFQRICSLG